MCKSLDLTMKCVNEMISFSCDIIDYTVRHTVLAMEFQVNSTYLHLRQGVPDRKKPCCTLTYVLMI